MDLKTKLIELELVVDNIYLDKYLELIKSNISRTSEKHKTQKHHIIPRYYFIYKELPVDNCSDNLVNLLYKDHILAHYYLASCSSTTLFLQKNMSAIYKMSNCSQTDFGDKSFYEFISSLENYQYLYEVYAKSQGDHLRGKSQSPEHISKRVIKNTGKKRSDQTRLKMSAWRKGVPKSEEHKQHLRESIVNYFKSETPEQKEARFAKRRETLKNKSPEWHIEYRHKISSGNLGKIISEDTRRKTSIALSGLKKSDEHKKHLSDSKKGRIRIHNDTIEKYIYPNELNYYLELGYTKGARKNPAKERIWITDGETGKMIDKNLLDTYLSAGWTKGRPKHV